MNPFDLLNESLSVSKPVSAKPASASAKTVDSSKAVKSAASTASKSTANANSSSVKANSKNGFTEMNASINEKTPLRTGKSGNSSSRIATGNDRQERRKTDRHSRTGYKQDGEKKMTGGKASWGKAVDSAEEHVSVNESVAIADGDAENVVNNSNETANDSNEESSSAPAVPVVPQLTLAQYQATLKKPATAANVARKVTTSVPESQILKKETEVFVFPEIVKKSVVASGKKSEKVVIDLSKYISVKAVSSSSVERTERSGDRNERSGSRTGDRTSRTGDRDSRTGDRDSRTDDRDSRTGDRNSNNRRSTNNNRNSTTTTPAIPNTSNTKLNLKDDRAFPSLGSK